MNYCRTNKNQSARTNAGPERDGNPSTFKTRAGFQNSSEPRKDMTIVSLKSRQRSPNLPSGITEKMFRFAEGVADGLSAADSYRAAFNTANMLPKTVRDEASRLLKNPGVTAALEARRAEKTHQQWVSRQKSEDRVWEHLWELIDGVETPPSVKVRALTLAAELAGMFNGISVQNPVPATAEELELELKQRLAEIAM